MMDRVAEAYAAWAVDQSEAVAALGAAIDGIIDDAERAERVRVKGSFYDDINRGRAEVKAQRKSIEAAKRRLDIKRSEIRSIVEEVLGVSR